MRGGATEGFLKQRSEKKVDIVPVKNVSEGLMMAAFGQVKAFMGSLAVASYHISQEGITNLNVVGTTDFFFELRDRCQQTLSSIILIHSKGPRGDFGSRSRHY